MLNKTEELINIYNTIHNNKYDYSKMDYVNNYTKIIIICPIHGEFTQQPLHHKNNHGCKKCAIEYNKSKTSWTTEIFIEKALKVHNNFYDYSKVDYKGINEKIIIICPIHGEFEQVSLIHIQKHGCLKCGNSYKRTNEEFILEVNKIHNDFYDYSKVNFKGINHTINIICPKHGEFKQKAINHLKGHGCSKCNTSSGEKAIALFLDENQIIYHQEYKFNDCLSIKNHKLKFDFYLPDFNTCIEFDGQQHFKIIEKWGKESFEITQRNDKVKDQYCLDNNIDLLRIKYTDFKIINKILFKALI